MMGWHSAALYVQAQADEEQIASRETLLCLSETKKVCWSFTSFYKYLETDFLSNNIRTKSFPAGFWFIGSKQEERTKMIGVEDRRKNSSIYTLHKIVSIRSAWKSKYSNFFELSKIHRITINWPENFYGRFLRLYEKLNCVQFIVFFFDEWKLLEFMKIAVYTSVCIEASWNCVSQKIQCSVDWLTGKYNFFPFFSSFCGCCCCCSLACFVNSFCIPSKLNIHKIDIIYAYQKSTHLLLL